MIIQDADDNILVLRRSPTDNKPTYRITLVFKAPYTSGEIKLSFEHDDFKWISPEDFDDINIPEKYKKAVGRLL